MSRSASDASHEEFARVLGRHLGGAWRARAVALSGFCDTWRAQGDGSVLFVKAVPLAESERLEAEADGLVALAGMAAIRVPAMHGCWRDERAGCAVLALEWLDLQPPDRTFGARFGRALAALHRGAPPVGEGRYGWRRGNRIGATPQCNRWSAGATTEDWIGFVRSQRLGAMRARLAASAALCDAVLAVEAALAGFFDDGYAPRASVIHGDLWSGNWGMLADGTPVIYDPAVSCSDPEAELAMMELFGQPPAGFWPAYAEGAGVHAGYARRRGLYQLYHLLNHAVLFGASYVGEAQAMAARLVRGA